MIFFTKKTLWLALIVELILFAGGAWLGWKFGSYSAEVVNGRSVREVSSEYKFISPLLYVSNPESRAPEFLALKDAVSKYINDKDAKSKASNISVYYRDLNSSQWVGLNPQTTFSANSMLEIMTLISIFRIAGDKTVIPQELLDHLLSKSDDTKNIELNNLIDSTVLEKTYSDLEIPRATSTAETITAQNYSHIFRALYNGTYLPRDSSEKALEILSRTSFNNGLVAGVPKGIVVSHKFGESISDTHELEDCGIVYFPGRPYFLCVMTRGSDYGSLLSVIRSVSAIVWGQVDSQVH